MPGRGRPQVVKPPSVIPAEAGIQKKVLSVKPREGARSEELVEEEIPHARARTPQGARAAKQRGAVCIFSILMKQATWTPKICIRGRGIQQKRRIGFMC